MGAKYPWFYVDAKDEATARETVESDGYKIHRLSVYGELSNGQTRYKVFVSEGRGVR
jgi:CRISPR/Cas system-associated protein endoribonuclease Cas2